jgi:hypothetical protein
MNSLENHQLLSRGGHIEENTDDMNQEADACSETKVN